ncbi:MAG: T9SS type A sorting domain-containing protein [Bacteroidales bacterium]|jgi:PKD repeat protein|nr:T9SS type A sorting domain-containing protein [Bacteroidales bacterium]
MKLRNLYPLVFIITISFNSYAQDYSFEDFVGTWNGSISSTYFGGYNDPMTMIIYDDHFYTETSGHLMPTIYPNTQQCDFDEPTNRMHWWWLETVYAGQHFYHHEYYEVVYFSNDTLIMHYNFWDDPVPNPDAGMIFLVRETLTPSPSNLSAQILAQNIQLNWNEPSNVPQGSTLQCYNVYYSENNSAYVLLDDVQGATSYTHAGYFQAGSHAYYVTAVYNIGESAPSNEAEIITTAIAPVGDFMADNTMPTIIDTVSFTDLSANEPASWFWSFSPATVVFLQGTNAYSQHPVVKFNGISSYTVTLTVSNIAGEDMETKTAYINSANAAPVADFTVDNIEPLVGEVVSFTDMSMYEPDSWNWVIDPATYEFVDGTGPSSQNPKVKFLASDIFSVELTVTNSQGSDSKMEFINVMDGGILSVMISATETVICEGISTELTAVVYGGSEYYTYSWTSDPAGFTSSEPVVEVSPDVTTTYMVEVYDGNSTASGDIEIMVSELTEIILENWPGQLCQDEPPVQLYAMPEGGIFSGEAVTPEGIFNPEQALSGWNVITYTYMNAYGCESMAQDSVYVDNCTSTDEFNDLNATLRVYPNPATDALNILSDVEMSTLRIFNNQGRLLQILEIRTNEYQMNVSGLGEGLYFFIIETAEGTATRRVLVQ